jgi:O-antigen ligase/cytochrome c-type biogenesis protein CcmH/NrfG
MNINQRLIKIAKILLYLTALTPFILAARYSFPYVTVRTVWFRLIIEVVLILVVWLLVKNKFRLTNWRQNYFIWLFAGLLLIELIAAVAGESLIASLFSDLERMWGIFTVLHLFLFYLLLRGLFRAKEWRVFFHLSLAVSLLVAGYGIIQRFPRLLEIYVFEAGISRITSTLGNPAYVAIYLLFNIALAVYLLLKNRSGSLKYFYLAVLAVDALAFSLTDIRGAYLGALGGLVLAVFLYLWLGRNKKYKIGLAALVAAGAVILALAYFNSDSQLAQRIPVLNRLSSITLESTTVKTRFIGWNAAWQGIKQNPFLGVGMENYNILFNRYFPAAYYNLAPTETYFDRAHNQFINLAAESGVLALLIYLGFPLLIVYYLVKSYRENKIALAELSILLGLSLAYFIHLFFVFDDLNSFLFFTALIAFVEFNCRQNNLLEDNDDGQVKIKLFAKAAAILAIVLAVYAVFSFNFNVLRAARASAFAYMATNLDEKINFYDQSLDLTSINKENIVINYVNYLLELAPQLEQAKQDQRLTALIDGAIKRAEAGLNDEIKIKPNDAFYYLKLGQLNNMSYLFYDDQRYVNQAIDNLNIAIALSPQRLQFYYVLGESYIISDQPAQAVAILQQALALNPKYKDGYYFLGRAYLADQETDQAYKYIIEDAIGKMAYNRASSEILIMLSQELAKAREYQKVIEVYLTILHFEPDNSQVMASLAAAYLQLDQYDQAISYARQAAALDSAFAPEAQTFIDYIESGRAEELKQITQ